jgi:hypothetical protein
VSGDVAYLLLHGYGGNGPEHWQTWLAGRLRAAGADVRYPQLPAPDTPSVGRWLDALEDELAGLAGRRLVVVGHSCGALLWLHRAARDVPLPASAERVLLVSPPAPWWRSSDCEGFMPLPLDRAGLAARGGRARLVLGAADPYCGVVDAEAYASALGIPLDVIDGAEHLNTADGYGPWPSVEAWCRDGSAPLVPAPAGGGTARKPD